MRLRDRKGTALLETVLAVLIMAIAGLSLIGVTQKAMIVSLRAREQQTCARLAQTASARLKNIDFYFLFSADTSQADHGLQAAYPYRAVLTGLQTSVSAAKFTRLRVQTTFMRRDSSDANADGRTSDLIAFTDADGNLVDDYDANIRYLDQNGDGDFFDTYASAGRTVAEQPDTHIKQVTVDLFRFGRLVCSQTELVSLEQFGGEYNPSSEAVLSLLLSTPTNNGYLYRADTAGLLFARNLVFSKAYPPEVLQFRAEAASPLVFSGETDPLSTVRFYVGASAELSNTPADALGVFSAGPLPVTGALVEGDNQVLVQAVKGTYTSPITARALIYDFSPPLAAGAVPTGAVNTLAPYVAITLTDPGVSTTTTSGICPDVISLKVDGVDVPYSYSAVSGQLVWVDSMTGTVPVLSSATYTMTAEAGDYAGYKATASWTFTLSVSDTDHSAPSIADKSPIGAAGTQLPVISVRVFDNQSGIIPSSIILTLDGSVVLDASSIGPAYDPAAGTVSYTPASAFASGSAHSVSITASHWAAQPPDKVTSVDTWGFTVP